MQSYPLLCPNYPPPPIPTRETIINEGLRAYEQSKTDEQWLRAWLERKTPSKTISLSDYRQKLIEHARFLREYAEALKRSQHENLNELKMKIEEGNVLLYDDQIVRHVQKEIQRRKSKRARLRRQKQREDERIERPSPPPMMSTEKPVNERIKDLRSILRTIEQLQTIRQQRPNDQLVEIQNLCTTKLLEYENELKRNSQSSPAELCNYLFNNQNQSFYQSTNPDAQYFLRAHQNLNDLIQIRQGWDQYSSTHLSSLENQIPAEWHEPQSPSDSNWTRFIFPTSL